MTQRMTVRVLWVTLFIFFAEGCKSTEDRIAERNARISEEFSKSHVVGPSDAGAYVEETREEKIARAQLALKEADERESPCDRMRGYNEVLSEFSDIPQAKFAERKRVQQEKKVLAQVSKELSPQIEAIITRAGKDLATVTKAEELIAIIRESLKTYGACGSAAVDAAVKKVEERVAKAEAKMLANREKHHGY